MVYRPQCFSFFLSLITIAFVSADKGPQPGDPFDASIDIQNWWFELSDKYVSQEVRKCAFLHEIPDTNDYCPHIWGSRGKGMDHYYCIFGTEEGPTWFCTCMNSVNDKGNDFRFHCGSEMITVDETEHPSIDSIDMVDVNKDSTGNSATGRVDTFQQPKITTGTSTERDGDSLVGQPAIEGTPIKEPRPGDVFDYGTNVFPQWWYDLRDQYAFKEVRKCPFLHQIPDTGDFCPAIARGMDHYYCVFGTEEGPTWFCTCMEVAVAENGGYRFHCSNKELLTVDQIKDIAGGKEDV